MVSGFLTSPCDQARMSSAVARPIRSSSKTLTSSKGVLLSSLSRSRSRDRPRWRNYFRWSVPRPAHPSREGRAGTTSDLFDAAGVGPARQVDAELLRRAVHLVVVLLHVDQAAVGRQH